MVEHEELKQQVKKLIMAGKTDKALEILNKTQLSSLDKELIMLNSRFNKVKQNQTFGTMNDEDAQTELNQISLALLELVDKIEPTPP